MSNLDRRTLLKLLGGTSIAGALPWLQTHSAKAQDQESEIPLRVLFLEIPNGVRISTWEPLGRLLAPPSKIEVVKDWQLRDVMSPLEPYKSSMTMFENLDMVSAYVDKSSASEAHTYGRTHALVANSRLTEALAGGVSVDQYIAQKLEAPTRRASLVLSGDRYGEVWKRTGEGISYSAAGQPEPYLMHIPDIWDYIFPEPLTGSEERNLKVARRTNVYDMVRGDYDRLLKQLPAGDQVKIEQMLAHRSDIHRRLSIVNNREENRPLQSSIIDPWSELVEGGHRDAPDNRLWDVHVELATQLAAAALHTDTTRVVTLKIAEPHTHYMGYEKGDHGTTDWHDLDHQVSGDKPNATEPEVVGKMDLMQSLVMQKVRNVLETLDSLTEVDGQSLLKHTVVMTHSHIGDGSHNLTRLPWTVFGDAHGALKTGSFIRFPIDNSENDRDPTNPNFRGSVKGRHHGDLLATIATAMGVDTPKFGNPDLGEGVITEMLT